EVRLGDLLWRDADLGVELLRIFAVSRLAGGLSIGLGERWLGAGLLGGLSVSRRCRGGGVGSSDDWGCGQARDCQGHRGGEGELLHILLSKITVGCEVLRM